MDLVSLLEAIVLILAVASLCYKLVSAAGVHRLYAALCSALPVLSHTLLPLEESVQETGTQLHLKHPIQETGTLLHLKHPIQGTGTQAHPEHPVQETMTQVHLEHPVQETVVLDQATEEVQPVMLQVCEQESYQRILPALKVVILSVNTISRYEHFSDKNIDKQDIYSLLLFCSGSYCQQIDGALLNYNSTRTTLEYIGLSVHACTVASQFCFINVKLFCH